MVATSRFFVYDEESGKVVERKAEERRERPKWPIASDAAAIHPSQIQEAQEFNRAKGVRVEYTPLGQPVFTSPTQRRKYLRAWGYFDRKGYD